MVVFSLCFEVWCGCCGVWFVEVEESCFGHLIDFVADDVEGGADFFEPVEEVGVGEFSLGGEVDFLADLF